MNVVVIVYPPSPPPTSPPLSCGWMSAEFVEASQAGEVRVGRDISSSYESLPVGGVCLKDEWYFFFFTLKPVRFKTYEIMLVVLNNGGRRLFQGSLYFFFPHWEKNAQIFFNPTINTHVISSKVRLGRVKHRLTYRGASGRRVGVSLSDSVLRLTFSTVKSHCVILRPTQGGISAGCCWLESHWTEQAPNSFTWLRTLSLDS